MMLADPDILGRYAGQKEFPSMQQLHVQPVYLISDRFRVRYIRVLPAAV